MTPILMRIAAPCLAVVAVTFVSGCSESSSTDQHAGHDQTTTAENGEAADHNADDVAFAQNMIPHHQQAVEMAALAQGNAENPQVRDLANAIIMAQTTEIEAFREWLTKWNAPEAPEHGDHSAMPMQGMVDQATMDRMKTLHGPEFERLWLESMIAHHQGAIEMSNAEIANGKNPDVIQMAKTILADQQAEIDQ